METLCRSLQLCPLERGNKKARGGRWEWERRRPFHFSIITIFIAGIPSGSLCEGESPGSLFPVSVQCENTSIGAASTKGVRLLSVDCRYGAFVHRYVQLFCNFSPFL